MPSCQCHLRGPAGVHDVDCEAYAAIVPPRRAAPCNCRFDVLGYHQTDCATVREYRASEQSATLAMRSRKRPAAHNAPLLLRLSVRRAARRAVVTQR